MLPYGGKSDAMEHRGSNWELFGTFTQSSVLDAVRQIGEGRDPDPELIPHFVSGLLGVSLEAERASAVFGRILKHHRELARDLGRSVDLRVAAMDFAVQNPDLVEEPIVVDRRTLERSQRLAAIDGLTGLFNRRFLDVALAKELNRARRYGQVFSVLFVDLDDFKSVNDSHGHDLGDSVLRTVGAEISELLRQEDIAARYGGEEFFVIMPQTPVLGATQFAERLRARIKAVSVHPEVHLSFSGGIASYPDCGTSADSLVHSADTALYQAKLNGKDQVRVSGSDKRRAPRFVVDAPAGCFAGGTDLGEVHLLDISLNGFSVASGSLLSPGTSVRVRVRDTVAGEVYDVGARVVWSRKTTDAVYRFGGAWAGADSAVLESVFHAVAAD